MIEENSRKLLSIFLSAGLCLSMGHAVAYATNIDEISPELILLPVAAKTEESGTETSDTATDPEIMDAETPDMEAPSVETPVEGETLPEGGTDETPSGDSSAPEQLPLDDSAVGDPDIPALITDAHTAYMTGVGNGMFNPEGLLTRAQAAAVLYSLLTEKSGGEKPVQFIDVPDDEWYTSAVNVCASYGLLDNILNGDSAHFRPNALITRAELVTILSGFSTLEQDALPFSDVSADDWYAPYVVNAYARQWISGFPDGTFRPNDSVSRAAAVSIFNRMLGRSGNTAELDRLLQGHLYYGDVPSDQWYYSDIMEASISHEFQMQDGAELWSAEVETLSNGLPDGPQDIAGKRYIIENGLFLALPKGFNTIDGMLCHVSDGCAIDLLQPGFYTFDGVVCHVSAAGPAIDQYDPGFQTIDDSVCYIVENGYEIKQYKPGFYHFDGALYHVTSDGYTMNLVTPGFQTIEGELYHVSVTGPSVDIYTPGLQTIESKLCYVSADGMTIAQYEPGFTLINGTLYHVSADGYSMDKYTPGLLVLDSDLYCVMEDGYAFRANSSYQYLTFGADGKYTSGDAAVDSYVKNTLAACTNDTMSKEQKRRAVYLYIRDNAKYRAYDHSLYGCDVRGSTGWTLSAATTFFQNSLRGNCYMFSSAFLYCVRQLGFSDAYPVSGGLGSNDADHAWVMMGGSIYDVELEYGYRAGKYGSVRYVDLYGTYSGDVFSYNFP